MVLWTFSMFCCQEEEIGKVDVQLQGGVSWSSVVAVRKMKMSLSRRQDLKSIIQCCTGLSLIRSNHTYLSRC